MTQRLQKKCICLQLKEYMTNQIPCDLTSSYNGSNSLKLRYGHIKHNGRLDYFQILDLAEQQVMKHSLGSCLFK